MTRLLRLPRRRATRALLAALLLLVAAPVLWILALVARAWPDPAPGWEARRGEVARVERERTDQGAYVREDLRVVSTSGLAVEIAVRRPDAPGRRPLIVLLGGHRTGKEAAMLVDDTGGAVVAALDYPYDGPHRLKGSEVVTALPRVQDALHDAAPAVRLALDALVEEPYVDPARIELVGVSLGALLGPAPAALDERFRRVWLVHGAAEPVRVLEHALAEDVAAPLARPLAVLLGLLTGARHLAPERWVPRIAPREVVMVNALDDERLPRESVERLHACAGSPSEVVWLPGGHVRPSKREVVAGLVELVLERIDAPASPASPGSEPRDPR